MQRKISNIKYKLHSIPILLNMKNKSNVLYSIPCVKSCACTFCRVVNTLHSNSINNAYSVQDNNDNTDNTSSNSHSTNVVRWTSPHLRNRTRSSRIMTPYSRISSWSKVATFTFLLLSISFLSSIILNNGSCSAASTSLTIDGGSSKTISETIAPNETKYVSSNVSYSATDTSAYTLKLTYANGSSALALDNGSGSSSGDGSSGGSGGTSDGSTTTIPDVVNNTTGSSIKNAWGYSWTSTDNTNYEGIAYNAIPAYGSSTNIETGTTISSTTKQLVFAANLSDSNPTGHYKTNLLLSLVATPSAITHTLTLNNNGGTGGTTSKTCSTYTGTCEIKLSEDITTPTRTNYTFLGWADSNAATTATYTTSSTITMSGDKTIYAVWKDKRTINNITYMQDMTSDICANTSTGTTYTLKDSRDNSSYTVRKFNDGKCWMTQNLKLMGSRTLTSSDSNVTSSFTLPASSISGFSDNTAVNAYLSGSTGYYTWCAATAGTCTSATSSGQEAPSSICPKGWKLPSGGSSGEYNTFATAESIASSSAGSTKIQGSPYNFAYTGRVDSGALGNTSYGYWWSRTAYGNTIAYYLGIGSSGVSPGTGVDIRYVGVAVRCVAQ